MPRRSFALAFAIPLLFLGTACSTVSTRIKEQPQTFSKLAPAQQDAVKAGKIQNGFDKDAVYLAWGKADDVSTKPVKGRPSEMWTYYGFRQETIPHYDAIPRYVGYGSFVPELVYSPVYINHQYVWRTVTFQNGKVIAWHEGELQ